MSTADNTYRYGRVIQRFSNQGSNSRDKIIRVMEWMAFSYRALKIYEVQDGIIFRPGSTKLDEKTTLMSSNVWELCKPLIEEGPNGTLCFVHFSAKEYVTTLGLGQGICEALGGLTNSDLSSITRAGHF